MIDEPFGDSEEDLLDEERLHYKYAHMLEREIRDKAIEPVKVHKFLMGLRGGVSVLKNPPKKSAKKPK